MSIDRSNGTESCSSPSREGYNILIMVFRVWATSLEVFLRRDFGSRYFGLHAMLVLVLVPVYCLAWEKYDLRPMVWFMLAYLFMWVGHRISMVKRIWTGEPTHSYYTGWPHLMKLRPDCTEIDTKCVGEPGLTLIAGVVIAAWNAPLGTYLMIGAVCLFVMAQVDYQFIRKQVLDLNDAVISQQQVAKRFRNLH